MVWPNNYYKKLIMEEFQLKNEYIPLCDLLKIMGLCETGGHAKTIISEGEVSVNGEIELRKRCKIRAGQTVQFQGQEIQILPSQQTSID